MEKQSKKRREFLKGAAYAAPAILSLQAVSSAAKAGSYNTPPGTTPSPAPSRKRRKKAKKATKAKKL